MGDWAYYKDKNGSIHAISLDKCHYLRNNLKDNGEWNTYIKYNLYETKECKKRVVYVERKNGTRFFRSESGVRQKSNGGGEKTTSKHDTFVDFIYRTFSEDKIAPINIRGKVVDVYIEEIYKENDMRIKMHDGSYFVPDILLIFKKTVPEKNDEGKSYMDLFHGRLIIEIMDTHRVDDRKRECCLMNGYAILEHELKDKKTLRKDATKKEKEEYEIYKMPILEKGLNGRCMYLEDDEKINDKWSKNKGSNSWYKYMGDYCFKIFENPNNIVIEYFLEKDKANREKYQFIKEFHGEIITDLDFAKKYAIYYYRETILKNKK